MIGEMFKDVLLSFFNPPIFATFFMLTLIFLFYQVFRLLIGYDRLAILFSIFVFYALYFFLGAINVIPPTVNNVLLIIVGIVFVMEIIKFVKVIRNAL